MRLTPTPDNGSASVVPVGWGFRETGAGFENTTYRIGTGTSSTVDTYSFGSTASVDRAFGTLINSNFIALSVGAVFTNNTGSTLTGLTISFTGEEWRLGMTARGTVDRLAFELNQSSSTITGTTGWTAFTSLDFTSPDIAGTAGDRNGNAAADRTTFTNVTISGLNIANGQTFAIRWNDINIADFDDGLAIDDFSLTPVPEPSTWFGAALAVGVIGWSQRRRFRYLALRCRVAARGRV
jgi:hypothetical protein